MVCFSLVRLFINRIVWTMEDHPTQELGSIRSSLPFHCCTLKMGHVLVYNPVQLGTCVLRFLCSNLIPSKLWLECRFWLNPRVFGLLIILCFSRLCRNLFWFFWFIIIMLINNNNLEIHLLKPSGSTCFFQWQYSCLNRSIKRFLIHVNLHP